jgi:hypothetical protein
VRQDADENGENREAGQQTMLHHLHHYHHHLQSTPALIQAYFSASSLIDFLLPGYPVTLLQNSDAKSFKNSSEWVFSIS